jgi:hypothetical protein
VNEYFLPNNLTASQAFKAAGQTAPAQYQPVALLYKPVLLGQTYTRFLNRKYNLDSEVTRTALVVEPDRRGVVRWENHLARPVDPDRLDRQADPQARFAALAAPLNDARLLTDMERDFVDWVYRASQIKVWANESLKVYAGPEVSPAEFRTQCAEAARAQRDAELAKVEREFERKLEAIQARLSKEERELDADEAELSQRRMEELGTHAENVLSLFGKRRKTLTTSLSKRRLTESAKSDVKESQEAIEDFKRQIAALDKEKDKALQDVNDRWGELANQITEIPLAPQKKDIRLDLFGVAWMPFHVIQAGGQTFELPGYGEP